MILLFCIQSLQSRDFPRHCSSALPPFARQPSIPHKVGFCSLPLSRPPSCLRNSGPRAQRFVPSLLLWSKFVFDAWTQAYSWSCVNHVGSGFFSFSNQNIMLHSNQTTSRHACWITFLKVSGKAWKVSGYHFWGHLGRLTTSLC